MDGMSRGGKGRDAADTRRQTAPRCSIIGRYSRGVSVVLGREVESVECCRYPPLGKLHICRQVNVSQAYNGKISQEW